MTDAKPAHTGIGAEPIDPDTAGADTRSVSTGVDGLVLAAAAAGGALGALARWGAGVWWPIRPGLFPWTTFGINVVGCALIGVVMVLVTDVYCARRLVRPFAVTGVLGGFTTFSTYSVNTLQLIDTGHWLTALANVLGTLVVALGVLTATTRLTRRAVIVGRR